MSPIFPGSRAGSDDAGNSARAIAELLGSESTNGSLTLAGNSLDSSLPDRDEDFGELATGEAVDRYVILSRLGAGAMGVVYAAFDPELDRKVALKLLHPARLEADDISESASGRARLYREAKALARLAHPNVVAIHDVGVFGDQIFLAMEFVHGLTLNKWMKTGDGPRPWTEVVRVMSLAGAGLAAAHDAGLIHRDFKPDNVLIGEQDERVRVLDFGLAREEDEPDDAAQEPAQTDDVQIRAERRAITKARSVIRASSVELASQDFAGLTHTGALVGTPAYMSPEQHMGEPADARSDQFSFCVTFYQALYGHRPFTGETLTGLAFNVLQGKVRPAPAKTDVPARLRKTVLRGLAVDPKERYPSMRELLDALEPEQTRVRQRWLWAAATGALGVGIAVGSVIVNQEEPCSGARERLDGIWDATRRDAIEAAFAGTGLPYAASTWEHVSVELDDYAERWTGRYTEACEATRVRGEQSEALLDLRMLCLERGRTELRALSDNFAKADAKIVEHAPEGTAALPRLSACDDAEALMAAVPPPSDPAAREREQTIRERLAEARMLDLRGKWATALEVTRAAAADAEALEYPPLHADALLLLAKLQHQHDHLDDALATLKRAILEASRGHTDALAARAWIGQLFVVGTLKSKHEQALWRGEAAEASIARAGGDPLLRAELDLYRAVVLKDTARRDEAPAMLQAALETFERELGEEHPLVHRSLTGLALMQLADNQLEEADRTFSRALELVERVSGPEHPSVAAVLTNLANVAILRGQLERAHELASRAVAIRERVTPNHPALAKALGELASVEEELHQFVRAYEHYERALAVLRGGASSSHVTIAITLNNLATLDLELDKPAAAGRHFEDALELLREAFKADNLITLGVELNLGEALLREGRSADALPHIERALTGLEGQLEHHDLRLAEARTRLAEALLAENRAAEARAPIEAALRRYEAVDDVSEKAVDGAPEKTSEKTSEKTVDDASEKTSEKTSEPASAEVSEAISPAERARTQFAAARVLAALDEPARAAKLARAAEEVVSARERSRTGEGLAETPGEARQRLEIERWLTRHAP